MFETLKSIHQGRAKARRDIKLFDQYVHDNGGKVDFADPIFYSLGKDVIYQVDPLQYLTYQRIKRAHLAKWSERNPLAAADAAHSSAARRAGNKPIGTVAPDDDEDEHVHTSVALYLPPELAMRLVAEGLSHELLDEVAKLHEHDTHEDECEGIQMLRRHLDEGHDH